MKQKLTVFIKSILLLVVLSLSAAGCTGKPSNQQSGDITIKVWKPFMDTEEFQTLINDYQAKHPHVRIEYSKRNIENYEEDLLNALAGGTGPDIFSVQNAWLPQYMDKVAPAPDKTFIFNDYKNTFVGPLVDDFTVNNKVYGTAFSVDTLGLYYNKDLLGSAGFAVPPKTWQDLARQVRAITKQDNRGYFTVSGVAMGTTANVNRAQDVLYLLMLQQGVQPWSSDRSRPTFAQPKNQSNTLVYPGQLGLGFYTSFANPTTGNYTWNARSDYSVDAFANGRAAFLYGYSYTRAAIKQKSPNLNFDVTTVPQVSLDTPQVNFANYFGEVVSKQSKNSDAAWDFLKFVTTQENLKKYYQVYKLPASRKDLVETQVQDPQIGVFAHAALTAKAFYRPDQAKMDAIMLKAIDNVTLTGMRVEEALSQAEQQASSIGQ